MVINHITDIIVSMTFLLGVIAISPFLEHVEHVCLLSQHWVSATKEKMHTCNIYSTTYSIIVLFKNL